MKAYVSLAIVASLHYATAQVVSTSSLLPTSLFYPNSSSTTTGLSTSSQVTVPTSGLPTSESSGTEPGTVPTSSSAEPTVPGSTIPTSSAGPSTTDEVPTIIPPSSSSTEIPTTTSSTSPYGTSNPQIGIENIIIENVEIVVVGRLQRRQATTSTLTLAHRDIYASPTASIPFYPAVVGYPPLGGYLYVETRSNVATTPDPTPIFTYSFCAGCPATVTTAVVPGYIPGLCVGCSFDAVLASSTSSSTTPGGLITTVTATATVTQTVPVTTTCENGEISTIPSPSISCSEFVAIVTVPPEECTTFTSKKENGDWTTCTSALPGWTPKASQLKPWHTWTPAAEGAGTEAGWTGAAATTAPWSAAKTTAAEESTPSTGSKAEGSTPESEGSTPVSGEGSASTWTSVQVAGADRMGPVLGLGLVAAVVLAL